MRFVLSFLIKTTGEAPVKAPKIGIRANFLGSLSTWYFTQWSNCHATVYNDAHNAENMLKGTWGTNRSGQINPDKIEPIPETTADLCKQFPTPIQRAVSSPNWLGSITMTVQHASRAFSNSMEKHCWEYSLSYTSRITATLDECRVLH